MIGSAVGPYPYPKMVKEFQSVISQEAKKQFYEVEKRLPDVVMACVGGGSNSIGMFADFIEEKGVELIGVEAAGKGIETGEHASAMAEGKTGTLHGMKSYLLQDEDGDVYKRQTGSRGLSSGICDVSDFNTGIVCCSRCKPSDAAEIYLV